MMSLSDEDGFSSDESPQIAVKRPRTDTYGASSTTSFSSVLQESDEEHIGFQNSIIKQKPLNEFKMYNEKHSSNISRLSRSSSSDNSSVESDGCRPTFGEEDGMEDDNKKLHFNMKTQFIDEFKDDIQTGYSDKAKQMMSNMGYKPGMGLGKYEHGRTEPVEASTQKGRRGLGLEPSVVGDIPSGFKWTPDDDKPVAKEEVTWIAPSQEPLSGEILEEWMKQGPKKLEIKDENEFVDPEILTGVLNAKSIFNSLDEKELRSARFRCNPYETIGSVIFLNRAAVKMANIDAIYDYMFTKPKKPNGESAVDKKELLYFADVCAGPGGFSEYVLYRRGWRAKGFGFTLKASNDFKLSDFYAGTAETFNPYYGVENDGNIFNPANLTSLKDNVLKNTEDKGVHFLMADGGFSVEGQENLQEILSKQLYLCQCLAGLMLVRTHGHFVVKLFDIFTLFSVGLIYIMYHCFEHVSIHKPVTSRPANSERYLVCKWKRFGTEAAEKHLFSVNSILWTEKDRSSDVTELVPLSVLQGDRDFFEYIYKSNCVIGERQIRNLLKIAEFSKDKDLKEESQSIMREHCLQLWQLPDEVRKAPGRMSADDTLAHILSILQPRPPDADSPLTFKSKVLGKQASCLSGVNDLNVFRSVYDWHFIYLSSTKSNSQLHFFLGCGGKQVFILNGLRWRGADLNLTLPPNTLFYGEIVKELRDNMYVKAVHVIDAIILGGVDVSNLPLTERLSQCELFCAGVRKPFEKYSIPLRCKRLMNMEMLPQSINDLEYRPMKQIRKAVTVSIPDRIDGGERVYIVGSLMFLNEIKEPWQARMSKKSGHKYYYGIGKDGKPRSEYHIPEEARLDTLSTFCERVVWTWEPASAVLEGLPHDGVTRAEVEAFIQRDIHR